MSAQPLLSARNVHAGYGKIGVLHGVDVDVDAGEFVAILGANGAGKSTLLKTLLGIMPGYRGQVCYAGEDLRRLSVAQRVRRGISMIPEGRQLFADMTVIENLALGLYPRGAFRGVPKPASMEMIFELLPRLKERAGQIAGSLSGGEAQMLTIGRALIADPKLLLCDEPSLGLAPLRVAEMFETLDRVRRSGVAILLADQNAHAALRVADRAYVLETGRVAMAGKADALRDDARLRETYLRALP